jgi:hypothetical protein
MGSKLSGIRSYSDIERAKAFGLKSFVKPAETNIIPNEILITLLNQGEISNICLKLFMICLSNRPMLILFKVFFKG